MALRRAVAVAPLSESERTDRQRTSLPSREAQSPLAPSPVVRTTSASAATTISAAAVAAWEADAIEPDVSSRGSFYVPSVQSPTSSSDGASSPTCGARRRFRGLRVSIGRSRRRLSRGRRQSFQYHVPVHLMTPSTGARRRQSSLASRDGLVIDEDAMLCSFTSTTASTRASDDRTSHAPPCRRSNKGGWRLSSSSSSAQGYTHAAHTTRPWSEPAKLSLLELSDAEAPDPPVSVSAPVSVSDASTKPSRRHRAWSKLKAHAPRLPRLSSRSSATTTTTNNNNNNTNNSAGVTAPAKPSTATNGMFSISFYPWKMEAHGYYSTPEAAITWVPDTASAQCQLCSAGFNLARRRHHCRLCGRLVCNECSLQRTFLPFGEDALRRTAHRSLIKSGEPQRTCQSCASTLQHMVAQHDHRVKQFRVDAPPTGRNSASTKPASSGRSSLAAPDRQLQLARPRGMSKASLARSDELEQVLRARATSRTSSCTGAPRQQHVLSSLWLEQWLQFVQMDASDASTISSKSTSHGARYSQHHHHQARPSVSSSRGSIGGSMRRRSSRFAFGRRPGPITNYELLDFVNGTLVPRDGLKRSRGADGTGDYHVVSHDVWLVFLRLYGGGPCITIDDDVAVAPHAHRFPYHETGHVRNGNRLLLHAADDEDGTTPFDNDFGGSSRRPQWTITELDDATTAAQVASPPQASGVATSHSQTSARVQPTHTHTHTQQSTPLRDDPRQLALRATTVCAFEPRGGSKASSSRRPASTTAIAIPLLPLPLARSTSEHQPLPSSGDEHTHGRRKSLTFIGYLKKWRQGDESSRPSGASTTISQVDDDGVMLYDPTTLVTSPDERASENDGLVDLSRSRGPEQQRETIAAVSAFAAAAAEARRKSTMSLMRHSTALTTRETSSHGVMTA